MNTTTIIARLRFLDEQIQKMQKMIQDAPRDTLFTRKEKDGSYVYFKKVQTANGSMKEIYLGKKGRLEAKQIALRMKAELELKDFLEERDLLKKIKTFYSRNLRSDQFLVKHPGISQLLTGQQDMDQQLAEWKMAPYNRNWNHPDAIRYTTIVPGLLVRSKAEADIIARLEHFRVPYHYDEIVTIHGETLAIDLICRNRTSFAVWYWDHRGMLDKQEYIQKTLYCEKLFLSGGIIPWVNMIVTAETLYHPLDIQWVDEIIRHYLL